MARPLSPFVLSVFAAAVTVHSAVALAQAPKANTAVDRGRYLVRIGGCNDCHTTGYTQAGGKVPETRWLTGDQLGWRGPWGTTYPSNLRSYFATISEDKWVEVARTVEFRPPMPWFTLRDMTAQDLRAIYRFIRSLGAGGAPAPAFVPPGQEPKGPVVLFPAPPG